MTGEVAREARDAERVWTLPNALSILRLVGVPVFLWLVATRHDGWALLVLMASGTSDYLDGKLARRFGWTSRLGQLLDPIADRIYVVTTIVALAWREILPVWLLVVLLGRDVFMVALAALSKARGLQSAQVPVHFVGKAATFNLLAAFPLLLLAQPEGVGVEHVLPVAWGFTWWGTALYWTAALIYLVQVRRLLRGRR